MEIASKKQVSLDFESLHGNRCRNGLILKASRYVFLRNVSLSTFSSIL